MQTGQINLGFPSVGSWVTYGLGSENENLPAFIALCPGLPVVGPQLWNSAFLPGEHQAVAVDTNETAVEKMVERSTYGFYEPFTRARPAGTTEAEWTEMQSRARTIIADVINPAYRRHLDFYTSEYLPSCARTDSVSSQPGGADYYAFRVRSETTTDLTPREIHDCVSFDSAPTSAPCRTSRRQRSPRPPTGSDP